MRSLYVWPRSQALPPGTKEVVEALSSAGVPSYLLSNATVRTMYQTLPDVSGQHHTETEEQGEEGVKQEEEQEMSTMYETPAHSTVPSQASIQMVEERVPTKASPSMLPRPVRTSAAAVAHTTARVSGIPATTMKHEAAKGSTSSVPKMGVATKHESSKPSSGQMGHGSSGVGITEHICDDPRFPGKPLRILRLY